MRRGVNSVCLERAIAGDAETVALTGRHNQCHAGLERDGFSTVLAPTVGGTLEDCDDLDIGM